MFITHPRPTGTVTRKSIPIQSLCITCTKKPGKELPGGKAYIWSMVHGVGYSRLHNCGVLAILLIRLQNFNGNIMLIPLCTRW